MSRVAWYIALLFVSTSAFECPSDCKCYEATSLAVCSSIGEKFNADIRTLKITNPTTVINLESDLFENLGLGSLNTLVIENAAVGKIHQNAFRKINDLTTIKIVNSILPDIDNDTFVESPNLKSVSFTGSQLRKFENVVSETIEELDLSNCSLRTISHVNFDNFTGLMYLNLAHNSISSIEASTFSNLMSVEEINLSHNAITQIPSNSFENNVELNTLDLSFNPLRSFSISAVSDIEKLLLKSCKLSQIDETIGNNLDLLAHLDLSDNNIANLSTNAFSNLEELEYLDLSGNNLRFLHPDIFKNNFKLQKIILDNNSLKTLPSFDTTNAGLLTTFFSCNNCHLKLLTEDTFVKMPSLITLRLSNNKLEKAHFLKKLHSLSELDLSNNSIKTIDESEFTKNTALENINLSGNPLHELNPQIFKKNTILTKLNVSTCSLTKLWSVADRAYTLPSLKQLVVAHNNIRTIYQADLFLVPSLVVFDIEGNPLSCGEVFCNLIEWLNEHEIMQTPASSEAAMPKLDAISDFEIQKSSWARIVNASCGRTDTCDYDYDYDENDYDGENKDANDIASENPKEEEELFDDLHINVSEVEVEDSDSRLRRYSIVWPALVFVSTALLVLLIVANVTLLIFKRRGHQMQMEGLPQIKIIPWANSSKLKKHSGSVYQPLSEDRSGAKTPIISRHYEQILSPPEVHKPSL